MLRAAAAFALAIALLLARYWLAPGFLSQLPLGPDMAFLFLVPLLLLPLLGMRPRGAGLQFASAKAQFPFATLVLLVSLPLIFIASQSPIFYTYYPIFAWARTGAAPFIAYELLILLLMLATEFFFRGFLMSGMSGLGAPAAITLQAIPYVLVHFGKPPLEIPASLFAGLFFGWIDWRAKSILPSVILHWCLNIAMDAFCIYAYFRAF